LLPSTNIIGLSTDILDLQVKTFAAAAGYVDSSVLLNISDPPFVCKEHWATPTYEVCFFSQFFLSSQ
jgi:peroxiredoxin